MNGKEAPPENSLALKNKKKTCIKVATKRHTIAVNMANKSKHIKTLFLSHLYKNVISSLKLKLSFLLS